jgi:rare lipoprotein A
LNADGENATNEGLATLAVISLNVMCCCFRTHQVKGEKMKNSLIPLVISIGVALPSVAYTNNVSPSKQIENVAHKKSATTKKDVKAVHKKFKVPHKHHRHIHNAVVSKRKTRHQDKVARKQRGHSFKVVDAIMDPSSLLVGTASYYGGAFQGKKTASGERFNQRVLTAAHRTIPLNSLVEVTNLKNNKKVIVRINDRGPWIKNRIIDLSKASADRLGIGGIAQVSLRVLE